MSYPEQPDNNGSLSLIGERKVDLTSAELEILRIVNAIELKHAAGSFLPEVSTEIPIMDIILLAHSLPNSLEICSTASVGKEERDVPAGYLKVLWDDGTWREVYAQTVPGDLKLVLVDDALFMEYEDLKT